MRILTIILGLALLSARATAVEVNLKRALVIEGIIQNNLDPIGKALLAMDPDAGPADLIINSPGGSVTTGFLFLGQMEAAQAAGLRVRCFVPQIAASMAMHILLHCDERHVLNNSFLLWHRARVQLQGPLTSPMLEVVSRDLANIDSIIYHKVTSTLHMSVDDISYHFENETLHVGSVLASLVPRDIHSYQFIEGLFEALADLKILRNQQQGGIFGRFQQGEYLYLYTGAHK